MKYLFTTTVETHSTRVYQITKTDLKKNFHIEVITHIRDQFQKKEKVRKSTYARNNVMNKETFYGKVDEIALQFNFLKNNEIFGRIRSHDMIDNFNKK